MGREEARIIEKQEPHAPVANDDDFRCILRDGAIERADHEVFFLAGCCRHCHETAEEN
jgi:hypothetical protein